MTDKRWMRTLSGAKLESLVGNMKYGNLAEAEIERRARKRARRQQRLALAKAA